MAEVFLSPAVRQTLLSLQGTAALIDRTQNRLSSGLRVATPLDDAVAYFTSKSLAEKAADIGEKKDAVDQAVSALKTAINATESIDAILKQMKGLAISAKTSSDAEQKSLRDQFNELALQLNKLVGDATYNGVNLVEKSTNYLTVQFSEKSTSVFKIFGQNLQSSKLLALTVAPSLAATRIAGAAWSTAATSLFDLVIDRMTKAIDKNRGAAKMIGSNVSLLQTRLGFAKVHVNTLTEGADKLRLADLNEEGANLVVLQTRQQLSFQALALAGQAEQQILTLFR
jgi:flagellin-like hook-associated protein FlgL